MRSEKQRLAFSGERIDSCFRRNDNGVYARRGNCLNRFLDTSTMLSAGFARNDGDIAGKSIKSAEGAIDYLLLTPLEADFRCAPILIISFLCGQSNSVSSMKLVPAQAGIRGCYVFCANS